MIFNFIASQISDGGSYLQSPLESFNLRHDHIGNSIFDPPGSNFTEKEPNTIVGERLIKKAAVDYAAAGEYQIEYSVMWVDELIVPVYRMKVVLPYLNWKKYFIFFRNNPPTASVSSAPYANKL